MNWRPKQRASTDCRRAFLWKAAPVDPMSDVISMNFLLIRYCIALLVQYDFHMENKWAQLCAQIQIATMLQIKQWNYCNICIEWVSFCRIRGLYFEDLMNFPCVQPAILQSEWLSVENKKESKLNAINFLTKFIKLQCFAVNSFFLTLFCWLLCAIHFSIEKWLIIQGTSHRNTAHTKKGEKKREKDIDFRICVLKS